jgi:hypothetical protein
VWRQQQVDVADHTFLAELVAQAEPASGQLRPRPEIAAPRGRDVVRLSSGDSGNKQQ